MYDQKQFNQLLTDPNVIKYYLPLVDQTDITKNTKLQNVNNIAYVKMMLLNLSKQYRYVQQGLAYLSSDLDFATIRPPFKNIDLGLKKTDHGYQFDTQVFPKTFTNLNLKHHADLPPASYTDHYAESDALEKQLFSHHYRNSPDHILLFTIFYDDDQTPTIVFHSDSIYTEFDFRLFNQNENGFFNLFESHNFQNQNPVAHPFLNHNNFYGIDDQTVMETITHQLIDQENEIIDACIKIDPKFDRKQAQVYQYIDPQWFHQIASDNYYNEGYYYPIIYQDFLFPYDQVTDTIQLKPNTWFAQLVQPILKHLNQSQQQQLLMEMANLLYHHEQSDAITQDVDVKLTAPVANTYADQLIEHDSLKIDNHAMNALPIMNHNHFVQQLAQLADATTIYNDHDCEAITPVTNFKVNLQTNRGQSMHDLNEIHDNFGLNFDRYYEYRNHFTIEWHRYYLNNEVRNANTLIGFVQSDLDHDQSIIDELKETLTDHNYVINCDRFNSGQVNIVIQQTTQLNRFNFVVIPTRVFYQTKTHTINYRLAQDNLKALNSIENQRIMTHQSFPIQVTTNPDDRHYESYMALIFDRLANYEYDYDATKTRIAHRIKDVKSDPNYQKFITNL